jgi:hypothetical protein
MANVTCTLCDDSISVDELREHVTGSYHKGCLASIEKIDLPLKRLDATAPCALCGAEVSKHSIVVRPVGRVVHLACFFVPPAGRKSLGAAA